ncbi:MAG: DUF58 domain-containing protein [Planctomycetes bacterium]|nr:DUF58 domain-containing protein [Planctomycetota bacterium]
MAELSFLESPGRGAPRTVEELSHLPGLVVRSRVLARGLISGLHRSARPGVGTDFSHHSPYVPGDAPGAVDWRLYARTRQLYVRRYHHETQITAVLAVDCSASMGFGSGPTTKLDYARLLAATLAHVLTAQVDRVGLIAFAGEVLALVPPRSSGPHVRLLCDRLERTPAGGTTDLERAMRVAAEMGGGRTLTVVLSDLLSPGSELPRPLSELAHRGHDVAVFHLLDRAELDFPYRGAHTFVDPEGGGRVRADRRMARDRYLAALGSWLETTRRACLGEGIDYHRVATDTPPAEPLLAFVARRERG